MEIKQNKPMCKTYEGGLRIKAFFKESYENEPLISIITVVYNGKKYIEETIKSVLNQSYKNVEYIIIDGGSNDGTIDIIKRYEDKLDYWKSEPDNGIYHAMNKGIDNVTGKWVCFINSSDILCRDACSIVREVLVKNSNFCDVIAFGYSIANYKNSKLKKNFKPDLSKTWKMPTSHNSIIYKSNVLQQYKFNLKFKCASDFEQMNKIKKNKIIYKNDFIFMCGREDGFVAENKSQMFYEYFLICWKYLNKIYAFYWLIILFTHCLSSNLKKRFIPNNK